MFTNLGTPTLFLTFTCNDFDEDFVQLLQGSQPWDDPALFALHYKHKFQELLNRYILSSVSSNNQYILLHQLLTIFYYRVLIEWLVV